MDSEFFKWGVVAFAVAFFGVGVYRVVEFHGIGLSGRMRLLLTALHTLGCAFFASTLVTAVYLPDDRKLSMVLFVLALGFLAPGQFTVGMRIRSRASSQPDSKLQK
jgi:hypothetical protein